MIMLVTINTRRQEQANVVMTDFRYRFVQIRGAKKSLFINKRHPTVFAQLKPFIKLTNEQIFISQLLETKTVISTVV